MPTEWMLDVLAEEYALATTPKAREAVARIAIRYTNEGTIAFTKRNVVEMSEALAARAERVRQARRDRILEKLGGKPK